MQSFIYFFRPIFGSKNVQFCVFIVVVAVSCFLVLLLFVVGDFIYLLLFVACCLLFRPQNLLIFKVIREIIFSFKLFASV
jgi:hypothetical protein